MSSAMALAAVTAILKEKMFNFLVAHDASSAVGAWAVSAVSPDTINPAALGTNQLNIFLYQVTPNHGLRNADLPTRSWEGDLQFRPVLSLDLHYLITAYAKNDMHAEGLLGYAAQMFHLMPLLTRDEIRKVEIDWNVPGDNFKIAVARAGLSAQTELIKFTPQPLSSEEISKLWAAFQSRYRPTIAYQASVVLIDGGEPAKSALPVLTIGEKDSGVTAQADLTPPYPLLTEAIFPDFRVMAVFGDTISLTGYNLSGTNPLVRFTSLKTKKKLETATLQAHSATSVSVKLNDAKDTDQPALPPEKAWAVGNYLAAFLVQRAGETYQRTTNAVVLSLAPKIQSLSLNRAGKTLTAHVICAPQVSPEQNAFLIFGDWEVKAEAHETLTDQLDFVAELPAHIKPGDELIFRLRIDGLDSHFIDRTKTPPVFLAAAKKTIP